MDRLEVKTVYSFVVESKFLFQEFQVRLEVLTGFKFYSFSKLFEKPTYV